MNLKEAINQIEDYLETHHGGINFELKSKLLGISIGDKLITLEEMKRNDWGVDFQSFDKEFNNAINGILNDQ